MFEKHAESPCLSDMTTRCVLAQIIRVKEEAGLPLSFEGLKNDRQLIIRIAKEGDPELAEKALSMLPNEAYQARALILLGIGKYDEGVNALRAAQEQKKQGADHGATAILLARNDLDGALEIATLTIDWPYIDPNLPPGQVKVSMSGSCTGRGYPNPIRNLAVRFANEKQYNKAEQAIALLKQYLDNGQYGRSGSACSTARSAYMSANLYLAKILAENSQIEKARKIYKEYYAEEIRYYGKATPHNAPYLHSLGRKMHEAGLPEKAVEILNLIKNTTPESKDRYLRSIYDPTSALLAELGKEQDAVSRLQGLEPDLRNATYFTIIQAALKKEDRVVAKKYLDYLEPNLGQRPNEVNNALDDLDFAILAFDFDDNVRSKKYLDSARQRFNPYVENPYLYERLSFGGKIVKLYALHGEYNAMSDWVKNYEYDYNGGEGRTFISIADYYAEKENWKRFDQFVSEYAPLFRENSGWELDKHNTRSAFRVNWYLADMALKREQPKQYAEALALMKTDTERQQYQSWTFASGEIPTEKITAEIDKENWIAVLKYVRRHNTRQLTAVEELIESYEKMYRKAYQIQNPDKEEWSD